MQFKFLRLLFVLSAILLLSSCVDTTSTTITTSSDATFVSLSLAGNDSAKTATFTLDADGKTIVNLDSLPFRTRIDSLNPTFSFKSTVGTFIHLTLNKGFKFTKGKNDTVAYTGKDTVDFTQPLLKISNFASDGKSYILYNIKVNIHKVHPELYVWNQIPNTNLNSSTAKNQKAVILNDKFYYYKNDGNSASVFTSTDGFNWSSGILTGTFPTSTSLFDMIQFKGKLFVSKDGLNIYSSTNGIEWTKKSVSKFSFNSLLYVLNDSLSAVVQSNTDASYHFATSPDGDTWSIKGTIPNNFPVNNFASITLISTITRKSKVLVLGGNSGTGTLLNCIWSSEDGIYWVDFSNKNINPNSYNDLSSLAEGASIISYDNKLLLFGKSSTESNFYRESKDEGLSWQTPNFYNQIAIGDEYKSPITYKDTVVYNNYYIPHAYQSVVVDKNNRIFTIGGKSVTSTSTDIWTGKLNRKSFIR